MSKLVDSTRAILLDYPTVDTKGNRIGRFVLKGFFGAAAFTDKIFLGPVGRQIGRQIGGTNASMGNLLGDFITFGNGYGWGTTDLFFGSQIADSAFPVITKEERDLLKESQLKPWKQGVIAATSATGAVVTMVPFALVGDTYNSSGWKPVAVIVIVLAGSIFPFRSMQLMLSELWKKSEEKIQGELSQIRDQTSALVGEKAAEYLRLPLGSHKELVGSKLQMFYRLRGERTKAQPEYFEGDWEDQKVERMLLLLLQPEQGKKELEELPPLIELSNSGSSLSSHEIEKESSSESEELKEVGSSGWSWPFNMTRMGSFWGQQVTPSEKKEIQPESSKAVQVASFVGEEVIGPLLAMVYLYGLGDLTKELTEELTGDPILGAGLGAATALFSAYLGFNTIKESVGRVLTSTVGYFTGEQRVSFGEQLNPKISKVAKAISSLIALGGMLLAVDIWKNNYSESTTDMFTFTTLTVSASYLLLLPPIMDTIDGIIVESNRKFGSNERKGMILIHDQMLRLQSQVAASSESDFAKWLERFPKVKQLLTKRLKVTVGHLEQVLRPYLQEEV